MLKYILVLLLVGCGGPSEICRPVYPRMDCNGCGCEQPHGPPIGFQLDPTTTWKVGRAFSDAVDYINDTAGCTILVPSLTPDIILREGEGTGGNSSYSYNGPYIFGCVSTVGVDNIDRDLRVVAIHEISHCLGMDHENFPGNIMNPYIQFEPEFTSGQIQILRDICGS